MGAACSTKSSSYDEISNKQRNTDLAESKRDEFVGSETIRGITLESDVSEYRVGVAIDELLQEITSSDAKLTNSRHFLNMFVKNKATFYFNATLAYVCRGDEMLGEKEKHFIIKTSEKWGLTKNEIIEVLQNDQDFSKEMINATKLTFKQCFPNKTDDEIDKLTLPYKYGLLLKSIICASQDGFVEQEYDQAKNLAKSLGIDNYKDVTKLCVNCIKQEKILHDMLKKAMAIE